MGFSQENVINGTFGEVWVDGEYIAEIKKFNAKVKIDYEDINQARDLSKGHKMLGYEGEGEMVLHHVYSESINLIARRLKAGQQPDCTLMVKLDDPDSKGTERVALTGVTLKEMTLADFEAKKAGEETIPFYFRGWNVLERIERV